MYFERFCLEKGIKKETIKGYKTSINHYTKFHQMKLDELIDEAIREENDSTIKKRQRNIKQRLISFQVYQRTETDLKISTIQNHMKNISSLYRYFDVEVPKIPKLKNSDENCLSYFDLATKEQINIAINSTGIRIASMILFMASSGTGRKECAMMTIKDFIDACSGYHTKKTLPEIIHELYDCEEPIVPTFSIIRQKSQKQYYTFCTPEAVEAILKWLVLRIQICSQHGVELKLEDSLWDLSTRQITYHFSNLNDDLKFGFKGSFRHFRPHSLRKFHASNIGLSQEYIDLLQGRSRGIVHDSYIKTNPDWLRKMYVEVMENVTIRNDIKQKNVSGEFTININLNFYGWEHGITL